MSINQQTRVTRFFGAVTAYPKTILLTGLVLIIAAATFIPTLKKDSRSDAFMPADHPALVYRDKVKDIFGLQDPMVIAVVNEGIHGVFTPHTLALVDWLTKRVEDMDNIDPEGVTSLATQNDIIGTEDGMLVENFFEAPPETQTAADKVRDAVMDFPLYLGSLVSDEATATLIVAELGDQTKAQQVYEKLLVLADEAPTEEGERIYIAGEGAVSGYMGAYIDADATRLNPIAALIITLVLFIAFRTLRGTLLPNFIVLATVGIALGTMAAFDVSFFVITNALPVVLIGIAVADSIHILSQYYEEMVRRPFDSSREIVIRTMVHMWRPVALTTFTTMAGFIGLSIASVMPPMQYFGLFATIGVAVAGIFSLTVLPAGLSMLKLKPSRVFVVDDEKSAGTVDVYGRTLTSLGRWVNNHHVFVLITGVIVVIGGIAGGLKLELNEDRITTFQKDEPIVLADKVINQQFDGVHYLDIVIETPEVEDMFKPENLKRIEGLQSYVETLPHVKGSTSVVDYLKQMNRALHEDRKEEYRLPDNADLAAQYFLLYSASSDPSDFEEQIDYDYRLANVRVRMDTGVYTSEKVVVEATQQYIDNHFDAPGINANLSGRVNVDYHWIKRLGESHFGSVGVAMFLVWLMASISLRSVMAGVITIIPVAISILLIYAVMGISGIWLAVGTSMFAALSIGLGVDFSIHTVARLQILLRDQGLSFDEAVEALYPTTGRALFFNFAALALGFGVLVTSEVVPLINFGSLVAVSVTVSFLASMTVLPALVKTFRPAFLFPKEKVTGKLMLDAVD